MPPSSDRPKSKVLRWQQTDGFASFVVPSRVCAMSDHDRVVASTLQKYLPFPPVPHAPPQHKGWDDTPVDAPQDAWTRLLPFGGGVIQHRKCSSSRERPGEALGEHLMTEGVHCVTFTILRGTGTGMRVGVASEDGAKTWGFRLLDGRLSEPPPPPHTGQGSPGWLRGQRAQLNEHRTWALSKALDGTSLPKQLSRADQVPSWDRRPGEKIGVVINMASRTLVFLVGGSSVDAEVELPESGVRMWFESRLKHDAVAISEYRYQAAPAGSIPRRNPSPRVRREPSPSRSSHEQVPAHVSPQMRKLEKDLEEYNQRQQAVRGKGRLSPGPGAYKTQTTVGEGVNWTIGPLGRDSKEREREAIRKEREARIWADRQRRSRSDSPRRSNDASPHYAAPLLRLSRPRCTSSSRGGSPMRATPDESDELRSARHLCDQLLQENDRLRSRLRGDNSTGLVRSASSSAVLRMETTLLVEAAEPEGSWCKKTALEVALVEDKELQDPPLPTAAQPHASEPAPKAPAVFPDRPVPIPAQQQTRAEAPASEPVAVRKAPALLPHRMRL